MRIHKAISIAMPHTACIHNNYLAIYGGYLQGAITSFSWIFTVYHRDTSGKELQRCMVISPIHNAALPSSIECVYISSTNRATN